MSELDERLRSHMPRADTPFVRNFRSALRAPGFARLALTYTLDELADWLATIALTVLVFDATGSALATTALFLASKFAPAFLVPPLAARFDGAAPPRLLGVTYAIEAVLLVLLAVVGGAFWLPAVLVLALLVGTLAAFGRATTRAATVAVLEPAGLLREGNATLNVGFSTMNAAAPAAAGGLVALTSPVPVLLIAAVAFAAQAVIIVSARGIPTAEPEPAPWQERLREALAYVRRDATLRTLLGGQALVLILLTMVAPIEVVYAKESLGVGDAGFGLLLASWGVGMVLGSALFARERGRSSGALIVASTSAVAAGYIGMGLAPGLAVACAAAVFGGTGNGVQWVAVVTALQEATADRFQARVAGLLESVLAGAPGVGFLLGGIVTALLSPRVAFLSAGVGVLVILAIGAAAVRRLPPARSRVAADSEPEPQPVAA